MNVKLTLQLDQDIIEKAKHYAQSQRQSLSALVQNYFTYFFKIEKYVGDRRRKKLIEYIKYYLEMPEMISSFKYIPIKLYIDFDIKQLLLANTTEYIPIFYAFL